MKYLVVETHLSYAVVLDEKGMFINVANLNYEEGQYVDDIVIMEEKSERKIPYKRISAVVGVAACILIAFVAFLNPDQSIYGSVYLTVNPEVQMDVNKKGQVVECKPLNEDGKTLTQRVEWKNRDVFQVTDEMMDLAIELGMLTEEGDVLLEIDTDDDDWFSQMGGSISIKVKEHLDGKVKANVKVERYHRSDDDSVDSEVVHNNNKKDKSTNKNDEAVNNKKNSGTDKTSKPKTTKNKKTEKKKSTKKTTKPKHNKNSDYDDDTDHNSDDSNYHNNDSNYNDTDDDSDSNYSKSNKNSNYGTNN